MTTNEQTPTMPATRHMTICNKAFSRNSGRYVLFPMISLSGKWLQEAGFKSGQVIDITCEDRKLTITLSSYQRFSHV
ncbi:MAG: SymE family type I addiction module toxin [Filimonas sp.]|nr:SymE family type I addiction module toxin [Filimonas sp.]